MEHFKWLLLQFYFLDKRSSTLTLAWILLYPIDFGNVFAGVLFIVNIGSSQYLLTYSNVLLKITTLLSEIYNFQASHPEA